MRIDIILVDDHLPFRACLKGLLEQWSDFAVVAQAEPGGQVVPAVKAIGRSDAPCVILMDVNLPVIDGIEAARRVSALALAPAVQVLALSTHDDPSFVAAMMAAGACGYMLKDDPLDELVNAIHEVAAGRRVFSSALELVQLQRRAERLLTAYQEELLDLDELRRRMPALRQREMRLKAELESLRNQLADQSACMRLAHTLNEFLERLRTQAQTLDVLARQRIGRLIVKEIVVGNDSIAIRYSIPNSPRSFGGPTGDAGPGQTSPGSGATTSSLLCT